MVMKKIESGEKTALDFANPKRAAKAQNISDRMTLQNNPRAFGLSESEKEGMIDQATQAATSKLQAAQSALGRMGLGGQGFQMGAFADAARGMAQAIPETAAKASAQALATSRAMIDREKARILGQLDTLAQRKQQANQYWGGRAIDIGQQMAAYGAEALGFTPGTKASGYEP